MNKRAAILLSLSFVALLRVGQPLLAQKVLEPNEKGQTPDWEQANALFHRAQAAYSKGDFAQALGEIRRAADAYTAMAGARGIMTPEQRKALLDERARKEREIANLEATFYEAGCNTENEMLKLPESIEALRREISSINARLDEQKGPEPPRLPADYSYVQGNILFKMNKLQEAESHYLKAIEAEASHLGAYNNLINLYYVSMDFDRALKFIEQAETNGVQLNPKLKEAVLQVAKK